MSAKAAASAAVCAPAGLVVVDAQVLGVAAFHAHASVCVCVCVRMRVRGFYSQKDARELDGGACTGKRRCMVVSGDDAPCTHIETLHTIP